MNVKKNYHWFSFILLLCTTFITPSDSIRSYIFGLMFTAGIFVSECMNRRRDENKDNVLLVVSSVVGIDKAVENIKYNSPVKNNEEIEEDI